MTRSVFLLFSVFVTLLVACGESEEEKVGERWRQAVVAALEGDGEKVCSFLTGEAKRRVIEQGQRSCADTMGRVDDLLGEDEKAVIDEIKVTDVEIDGDEATVEYYAPPLLRHLDLEDGAAHLVKSGGKWLVPAGD